LEQRIAKFPEDELVDMSASAQVEDKIRELVFAFQSCQKRWQLPSVVVLLLLAGESLFGCGTPHGTIPGHFSHSIEE